MQHSGASVNVLTNGRAFALAIGDTLVLPNGRTVPLADAPDWQDTDADPSACTPACFEVAERLNEEEIHRQATVTPRPVVPRALPVLPAPRPFVPVEGATLAYFEDLCTRALAAIDAIPASPRPSNSSTTYAENQRQLVRNMLGRARKHNGATENMTSAVEEVIGFAEAGPARLQTFLDLCDTVEKEILETCAVLPEYTWEEGLGVLRKLHARALELGFASQRMSAVILRFRAIARTQRERVTEAG